MRDNKLIQLYITNMCNSRCKTCSIWKNEKREELRPEDIYKVVTAFPDADYVIGGGESILHLDIKRILFMLRENGANYTLLSNCIFSNTLYDLIEKYNVPAVTISFDGVRHNTIRRVSGNLSSIVWFIEWCKVNDVKVKLSYTYSKYNEGSFKKDMEFIKEQFGINEIYFCIAQDMDLLKTVESDESFVASNFEQILDCDMITDKDKAHIRGMITGVRKCCTSQDSVHTIYSNGDIVRCQSFKSKDVLGNIKDMTVDEIRYTLSSVKNERCQYDVECNLLCQRRYD